MTNWKSVIEANLADVPWQKWAKAVAVLALAVPLAFCAGLAIG